MLLVKFNSCNYHKNAVKSLTNYSNLTKVMKFWKKVNVC